MLHNILCTIIPLYISFTAVGCPALAPIPNGAITYDPDMTAPYDVDTVATYSCNDGYFLLGGFATRLCVNIGGGIWVGLAPVCERT